MKRSQQAQRNHGRTCRIIVVDDHAIMRDGLSALLDLESGLEVIATAGDGKTAVAMVARERPDLVLMDLSMPGTDGAWAIREIKRRYPAVAVLVLTFHKEDMHIHSALEAGADGYVLKDATHAELVMAIDHVVAGKRYLSPGISEKVIEGYLEGKRTLKPNTAWDTLTQREREILKLIAEGHKNKEIADYLCISLKTVEKHRTNLMNKLDIHNVASLTALAIEKGLVIK